MKLINLKHVFLVTTIALSATHANAEMYENKKNIYSDYSEIIKLYPIKIISKLGNVKSVSTSTIITGVIGMLKNDEIYCNRTTQNLDLFKKNLPSYFKTDLGEEKISRLNKASIVGVTSSFKDGKLSIRIPSQATSDKKAFVLTYECFDFSHYKKGADENDIFSKYKITTEKELREAVGNVENIELTKTNAKTEANAVENELTVQKKLEEYTSCFTAKTKTEIAFCISDKNSASDIQKNTQSMNKKIDYNKATIDLAPTLAQKYLEYNDAKIQANRSATK